MIPHAHCPLCVQPLQDNNPVFLFLDLVGVLIDRDIPNTHKKIQATLEELFVGEFERTEGFTELEHRIAVCEKAGP